MQEEVITLVKKLVKAKVKCKLGMVKNIIINLIIRFLPYKFLQKSIDKLMQLYTHNNAEYYCHVSGRQGYKKEIHNKNIYFPFKKLLFENKYYNVPNDYNSYLKKIYGPDYMELPPKEKRVSHNIEEIRYE